LIGKDNEVISIASSHEEDLGTISEMSVSEDGTGDRKTLASWLRKSKDKLTSMFHRAQTKLKITRGRYYRKGVGFMDAYRKGLDGRQAAWAAKKYRGHRVVPPTILAEFTLAHTL
jgi:hypothetical protein